MPRNRLRSQPTSSTNQSGFTLAETLASLFALSLATAALGQMVNLTIKSERKAKSSITQARETGAALREGQPILDDDGNTLNLEQVKPTLDATCLYDAVGRRCR